MNLNPFAFQSAAYAILALILIPIKNTSTSTKKSHLICHLQAELLQSLEDNDLEGFATYVAAASEAGADLNHQYGAESGFKTILHLALEEDDGLPYVEELLKV